MGFTKKKDIKTLGGQRNFGGKIFFPRWSFGGPRNFLPL